MAQLRRYIEPRTLVHHRLAGRAAPGWKTALVAFRDHHGTMTLARVFRARPWRNRMLGGGCQVKSRADTFEARVDGKKVGIAGYCGWGGPQAAIMVEELAAIGVRRIIGFGCCGGLVRHLPRGTVVAVNRSLRTDGTSLAYTRGPCRADSGLLRTAASEARKAGIRLHVATCATVDAIYRETPAAVAGWRRMGADVINMETTPFYAAARACGVKALWLGYVSDSLAGEGWDDWYRDSRGGHRFAARLCLHVVRARR